MKKLLSFFIIISSFCAKAQNITTVAGNGLGIGINGPGGYSGDGGFATNAELYLPFGIQLDATGNLYIADGYNLRVRKANTAGIISTIAGNGIYDYTGDGGAATDAEIGSVEDIAIDATGNIYFTDITNHVRKINAAGVISTVAGNGASTYTGDGGLATNAAITPGGITVDVAGNIYITDRHNYIRKINTAGIITTIAGNGVEDFSGDGGPATAAGLADPSDIVLDASGNLYVSEYGGQGTSNASGRIRKINTAGIISTIAGHGTQGYTGDGGLASMATLSDIVPSLVIDNQQNIFFIDQQVIRKVDANGLISTVAGSTVSTAVGDSGLAINFLFNRPGGLALDANQNLYVSDTYSNKIRKINVCHANPSVNYTLMPDTLPGSWSIFPNYGSNINTANWYWGDSTYTQGLYPSHTYTVAGTYSICVTVTDANGCSLTYCQNDAVSRLGNNSTQSSMIQVNVTNPQTTAISTYNTQNAALKIYPNPAQNNFTVEVSTNEKQTVYVYDVNGKQILAQTINGTTNIDASTFNAGVYNVSITNSYGTTNKRLIIVK